jgi:hypothetical protein
MSCILCKRGEESVLVCGDCVQVLLSCDGDKIDGMISNALARGDRVAAGVLAKISGRKVQEVFTP